MESVSEGFSLLRADLAKIKSLKDLWDFLVDMTFHVFFACCGGSCGFMWDFLYGLGGYGTKMNTSDEFVKKEFIRELIQDHSEPKSALLDMACGEGHCLPVWRKAGISSYVGVDISNVAIGQAERIHLGSHGARDENNVSYDMEHALVEPEREASDPAIDVQFVTSSMSAYNPDGKVFDCIVFNECLYYAPTTSAAVDIVRHAKTMLAKNGIIIISIVNMGVHDGLWKALEDELSSPEVSTTVEAPSRVTWDVRVYRP